jgi:type I site-specific restriction-modification system R (restriction) subunit
MKFNEVIEKLKEFHDTNNLDELSEHIGIKIDELKEAFIKKDYKTINIFFQKNKNSLLPILRQNGKIDDEKQDKAFKYRLRKLIASSRNLSNAIVDLKELYLEYLNAHFRSQYEYPWMEGFITSIEPSLIKKFYQKYQKMLYLLILGGTKEIIVHLLISFLWKGTELK